MANEQLNQYIKEQLAASQSQDSIKATLLGKGWAEADVNSALAEVGGGAAPVASVPAAAADQSAHFVQVDSSQVWTPPTQPTPAGTSTGTTLLKKLSGGLIKTDGQANAVLVVIALCFLALSGYIFYSANKKPTITIPSNGASGIPGGGAPSAANRAGGGTQPR